MKFSLKALSFFIVSCASLLILLVPYAAHNPVVHSGRDALLNLQLHRQSGLYNLQQHHLTRHRDGLAKKRQPEEEENHNFSHTGETRSRDELCSGRRVFIHGLPAAFNSDLLRHCKGGLATWINFCPDLEHDGFGEPLQTEDEFQAANGSPSPDSSWKADALAMEDSAQSSGEPSSSPFPFPGWYRTDPYMLEVIFHRRLLRYTCLTQDPDVADAFFLPYYTGIDALRFLYANVSSKPKVRHGSKLVKWLQQDAIAKKSWKKHGGRDHFLVISRTAWDFEGNGKEGWGTGFLTLPEVKNMTVLLVERNTWRANQHAIPYPTSFHPSSPLELDRWIHKMQSEARPYLFAFIGSVRPKLMKGGIRDALIEQCSSSKHCYLLSCKKLRCSHNPRPIVETFLHAQFCLQPRGDTATRRSLFDSIIAGCIPVLFHNDTAYTQYKWHLPLEAHRWSVYIDEKEIREGVRLEDVLMQYTQDSITKMRNALIDMLPRVVYAGFSSEQESLSDAVDVSVRELLRMVARHKRNWSADPSIKPASDIVQMI